MVLLGEKKMGEVEDLVEQVAKTEEIQSPSNCIKQPVSSDFEMGKKKIPPPEEVAKFLPEVVISGGWNKCWVEDVTPWDLGCPTPLVVHLVQTGVLPKGRGLVPGCGGGYDVVAMASSERYVVGLDISENAVKKAVETHSSRQNANAFSFVLEDFFTWRPVDLFDFVFDYVFFCAIEPDMRAAWGRSMSEILKPDGELITLMYPIGEHDGGPPYKVSVSDYEAALVPLGFRLVSIQDNELAVGPRKGREKLGRWKKIPPPEEVARFLPEVVISGGWDKCWVEDVTPWDLGRPTPLVVRLVETGVLPKGRGLVPGCGGGHDVVAMASSERFVVGLDISENALEKAVETHASRQNATWFSFVLEDFFTWRPTELFDFVFDYVFFCAIEPDMRAAWGKSMSELLKPDGELITLMYPIGEHDGGPPYKVSVSDYEEVLIPLGFRPVSMEDNELAVGPRKGKEKLGRWKKMAAVAEQAEEDANPKE